VHTTAGTSHYPVPEHTARAYRASELSNMLTATATLLSLLATVGDALVLTTRTTVAAAPKTVHAYLSTPANWPALVLSSAAVEGTTAAPLAPGDAVEEIFGLPPLLPLSVKWECVAADPERGVLDMRSAAGVAGVASDCRMAFAVEAAPGGGADVTLEMSYEPESPLAYLAVPALVVDNAIALRLNLPRLLAGPRTSVAALKTELLALADGKMYGAVPFTAAEAARFDQLVDALSAKSPTASPAGSGRFSGDWDLLWTTESEIRACVKSGLLGCACTGVYQNIDVAAGTLENVIAFEDDSFLSVGSTLAPDASDPSGKRFDFKFEACRLQYRGFGVPLPPIGKGWGDILFLDDTLRIQKDIRGDLLVAVKE